LKENHFIKLKEELHLFELRSLIKTEMMTKNKKHFKKKTNDEIAKFIGNNDLPTKDDDAIDDNDDEDDDKNFPPMIPCAGV
jgi:hypothetical protein